MYYGNPMTNLKELQKNAHEITKGENGSVRDNVTIHHHKAEVACDRQAYFHEIYVSAISEEGTIE